MIDILIPIYNKAPISLSCLDDYKYLRPSNHNIVFYDNGSEDNSFGKLNQKIADENITNANIIRSEKNIGFAKACNKMFAATSGDIVIFSNNDIIVDEHNLQTWTNIIGAALKEDMLVSPTGGMIDENFEFKYETNCKSNKQWNYLSGWLLCGYRKTFEKFCDSKHEDEKPFTESMTTYFEDTWLSIRAKELGINMKLIDVPIKHIGKQTSKNMNLSKMYMKAKNIFTQKCLYHHIFPSL